MDQVFLLSRALTDSEIRTFATRPPEPTMLPDIVFYWSFENVSVDDPYLINSDYNGTVAGRVLQSRFSMIEGLTNPPVVPVLVASQAPFLGSGYTVLQQGDATGVSIASLPGPTVGTPVITALPAIGDLYLLTSDGQKAASPLQSSDLPATATYGVRFEGALAAGQRSAAYQIGSDSALLIFVPNRAPSPRPSIVMFVDQSTQRDFALVRTLFAPPPNPRREFKYNVDADANDVSCTCTLRSSHYSLPQLNLKRSLVSSDLPADRWPVIHEHRCLDLQYLAPIRG